MKVAFLEPHFHVTGGIRHVLELGNHLVQRGHDVTYLLPSEEAHPCTWMPCLGRVEPIAANFQTPFDVLVFNEEPQWSLLGSFTRVSLTVYYLLSYAVQYDKPGSWESYRYPVDLRLANSHWVAERIQEEIGVQPIVITPGLDPVLFHPVKTRKTYDVLTYGSDRPAKGTADVEAACQSLGVRLEKYEGKHLPQARMAEEYSRARVFAVGSHVEGFGLPGLEALACGTPLVTTDNGGCREYAVHGETALLIPPKDPLAMAQAIHRLLTDSTLASRLRTNGLQLVKERFSWADCTSRFEEVVASTLQERRRLTLAIDEPTEDPAAEIHRKARAAEVASYTRVVPLPSEPTGSSSPRPLTSIITLSWDQVHHTRRFVESLRQHTEAPYELIIVDNGSTKETQRYVQQAADKALLNPQNVGFAQGMNQGARVAAGEYLVFINNDTRVPPGWLQPLLEAAQLLPEVGIVAPTVSAGGSFITVRAHPHEVIREVLPFSLPPAAVCYLMPKSAFALAGGWCEEYRLGGAEDVDLCFTLWARGRRILVDERVRIEHYSKGTAAAKLEDWQAVWRRNREALLDRWSEAVVPGPPDEGELGPLWASLAEAADPEERARLVREARRAWVDQSTAWARERARMAQGVASSWRETGRQREVATNLRRQLRAGIWRHFYRLYLKPLLRR